MSNYQLSWALRVFQSMSAALLAVTSLVVYGQTPYEIVRGAGNSMCQELVKNLNEVRQNAPMACRRQFATKHASFSVPGWTSAEGHDSLQIALALEKVRAEKGPPDQAATRFVKAKAAVEEAAAAGRLKAWVARLDIAHSGEEVRAVLVSNGECGGKYEFSWNDPIVGVLLPDRFEVDPRYDNMSPYPGDVILHEGVPYIAVWSDHPGATRTDRTGPPKRHKGYLLVSPTFWLPQWKGRAGVSDPICQIGHARLSSMKTERQ